jgi:hypothetical protein
VQRFGRYSAVLFREKLILAFQRDRLGNGDFHTAFDLFFSAISGISVVSYTAGTSMTGDFKNPSEAILKGILEKVPQNNDRANIQDCNTVTDRFDYGHLRTKLQICKTWYFGS